MRLVLSAAAPYGLTDQGMPQLLLAALVLSRTVVWVVPAVIVPYLVLIVPT